MEIEVKKGSVVYADADAIVNAANRWLERGDGVCGAIFEAAGEEELTRACNKLAPCATGAAAITKGYNLKAKYIIHAVGPVYSGEKIDSALLASAYHSSLFLADNFGCKSIAFCCISTGIYGYPLEEATKIAFEEVQSYKPKDKLEKGYFYCYTDREYDVYTRLFKKLTVSK